MAAKNYSRLVRHAGLNQAKYISADTEYELDILTEAQRAKWDEQWEKKKAIENRRIEKAQRMAEIASGVEFAQSETVAAEQIQNKLDSILVDSIDIPAFDIDSLKDRSVFNTTYPLKPVFNIVPQQPNRNDPKYNNKPDLLTKIFKQKLEEFQNKQEKMFQSDLAAWEELSASIQQKNSSLQKQYEQACKVWNDKKALFEKEQAANNEAVDKFKDDFSNGDIAAIERYFTLYLESLNYPFDYNNKVDCEYSKEEKRMIVDCMLPSMEDIPNLKSVTYVKSKDEIKYTYQSDAYMKKKYDSIVYQIVMQYFNCIFSVDNISDLIQSVVINGKIDTIDKSTGKEIQPYILSINCTYDDFKDINLRLVDPKAWFKTAKGIAAASIAKTTPIAPIIKMSRSDKRFIDGYDVIDTIDEGSNLASMDWQDFENLIRQVFEEEFNSSGGEVKITQASRDGGVDAVAFDPDPIRGGKIVIQAKRYTNVVGVSAVRDLYGTVLNEGASKGILVTTSNFGNDAYSFAQGKPLTLMNGANLLYLLEKHGHKAHIDIADAKKVLKESND